MSEIALQLHARIELYDAATREGLADGMDRRFLPGRLVGRNQLVQAWGAQTIRDQFENHDRDVA